MQAYSPGGTLNALATAAQKAPLSVHRLRLGLPGYLILLINLAFVSQCQYQPSRVLSPLVFFPISTHFTATLEIPSTPIVLKSFSFQCHFKVKPRSLTLNLKSHLQNALRPIIPDNACIFCITAAAGTELADAYSSNTVRSSSMRKGVYNPKAFILHVVLLRQAFAHCEIFPTAASRRSLFRVSVPVWLIVFSNQLLIVALVSLYLTNKLIRRKLVLRRTCTLTLQYYEVLANVSICYPSPKR